MPGITWHEPQNLISPLGTLDLFDGVSLDGFVPVTEECQVDLAVRATVDNIPQADGTILHSRYLGGYVLRPTYQLWDAGSIAIGETRREMYEELVLHLRAILNTNGRYGWTPDIAGARILDRIRLLEWPNPQVADNPLKKVSFACDSPFPYAIDFTEVDVTVEGTTTVTNPGNVPFWAVIQVAGASDAFTLTNNTVLDEDGNPMAIVFDSSLPGGAAIPGGQYLELVTFGGGKAYLNGDGANYDSGIDVLASDFFPLAPGDNEIVLDGADSALFKVNGAWGL